MRLKPPDYLSSSFARRGYDPDNMTAKQIDEFNDCWRGSIEEESAMNEE